VSADLAEEAGESEGAAGEAAAELLSDDDDTGGVSGGEAQSESMTSQGAETAQTEPAPDETTESVVAAS
jgi:hypothetical protein